MPSPCGALASAPCLSSVRTTSRSPRRAASATGDEEGAAATRAVRLNAIAAVSRDVIGDPPPRNHENSKPRNDENSETTKKNLHKPKFRGFAFRGFVVPILWFPDSYR